MRLQFEQPPPPQLFTLFDELAAYGRWLAEQKKASPEAIILADGATGEASDTDSKEPLSMGSLSHGN